MRDKRRHIDEVIADVQPADKAKVIERLPARLAEIEERLREQFQANVKANGWAFTFASQPVLLCPGVSSGRSMNKVSGFNQGLVALVAVIAVASGVALSSASANERHAAGTPTSLPPDVLSTVTAFHEALSAGNGAAVEALLSPTVVIMESGNIERSREEYAGHHLPADLKFMRAMKYTLERQSGEAIGNLAWVASEATLVGDYQGKPVNLVSMESLLLRKEQAGWRIVHIHWSSRSQSERR